MRKLILPFSIALAGLISFVGTAAAAGAVAPADGSLLDLAKPIFEAVMHGQYVLGAALALVFAVAAARRYLAPRVPFFASDTGGALMTLVAGFGGGLSTALLAGAAVSGSLLLTCLHVAVLGAGGFVLVKKLIADPIMSTRWYQAHAPGWLTAVINFVLWAFTKPDAVAEAEAAGAAAVQASPATGAVGIVGQPEDL